MSDTPLPRRPIGCPQELWVTLLEIRAAQRHLDNHEGSNVSGKTFRALAAAEALKDAHNALSVYIGKIGEDL